ncbi:PLAC8-like protein 1 [Dissostichus eleginoides]|uniref:PLAC8-like protein 1 n=1 Tax=Dissostichus eleginoides TaxID=100907 RepID=A0AAD9EV15_DISEL|nr:PLAC8-like protein 1 [Dissostichus eleginoides]
MTAQSREQSSRIKGHRRAAGRVDSTRRGASGRTAETQQQPRGGRIAVPGDERQGQCGSQQADRGEEAAEICDTSPPGPTALSPPYHPEHIMLDAFMLDEC